MHSLKEHRLSHCKAIAAMFVTAPLFAQYGGPAVLTRGQAPAAMSASQIVKASASS